MADGPLTSIPGNVLAPKIPKNKSGKSQYQKNLLLYALPAPLRTFHLPNLVAHNPISWFHFLYTWGWQALTQQSHINPLYLGWWSAETRSIHITDNRSLRGLWEQGFYGKGSLSRSEPNWMEAQKNKSEKRKKSTAEENTQERRKARQETKWERARKEQEEIDRTRLEEASLERSQPASLNLSSDTHSLQLAKDSERNFSLKPESPSSTASQSGHKNSASETEKVWSSPVGPIELLSLPNSQSDLLAYGDRPVSLDMKKAFEPLHYAAPVGPIELLALPNSASIVESQSISGGNKSDNLTQDFSSVIKFVPVVEPEEATYGSSSDDGAHDTSVLEDSSTSIDSSSTSTSTKRRKSVRFSPTVEQTTFIQSEPPSPQLALASSSEIVTNEVPVEEVLEEEILPVSNQEHYQLTMQEAFFLSYALGALTVLDPTTNSPIPNKELFSLFRRNSSFAPTKNPTLSPDDTFITNYVVYHHFRSLGWVVRGGSKFSCDILLYDRGPVFSHAEFAVLILPSYSDNYWSSNASLQKYVTGKESRTWTWLHCLNRVITQAKKTLVLVYIDIPKPLDIEEEKQLSIDAILGRYKVREFIMKRWSSNRER